MKDITLTGHDDIQSQSHVFEQAFYIPFLKYFEGYTEKEISDSLHLPLKIVRNQIKDAKKLFRGQYKGYCVSFNTLRRKRPAFTPAATAESDTFTGLLPGFQ